MYLERRDARAGISAAHARNPERTHCGARFIPPSLSPSGIAVVDAAASEEGSRQVRSPLESCQGAVLKTVAHSAKTRVLTDGMMTQMKLVASRER